MPPQPLIRRVRPDHDDVPLFHVKHSVTFRCRTGQISHPEPFPRRSCPQYPHTPHSPTKILGRKLDSASLYLIARRFQSPDRALNGNPVPRARDGSDGPHSPFKHRSDPAQQNIDTFTGKSRYALSGQVALARTTMSSVSGVTPSGIPDSSRRITRRSACCARLLARRTPAASTRSSVWRSPAVSSNVTGSPRKSSRTSITSRVVPGNLGGEGERPFAPACSEASTCPRSARR